MTTTEPEPAPKSSTDVEKRIYPPNNHLIRHLRMELVLESSELLRGVMPVSDDIRDAGGAVRTGALATFVDVAAGAFSHDLVRPDWIATTDMRLMVCRHSEAERVELTTSSLRVGKRNIVSVTSVVDAVGEVARGWVTYSRLPRRDDSPHFAGGSQVGKRLNYVEPDEATRDPRPPLDDYIGISVVGTGGNPTLELEHTAPIHNSFGSLQGGAAAILIERAATLALERQTGRPGRVDDLHLYYLGQTRAGPFRVETTTLRSGQASVTTESKVLDAGNDNRLLDLATATASVI